MNSKQKKRLMTDVAKGEITMEEADKLINPKRIAQKKPVGEEIAPINSKNGKKQRNKAREKLSDEAEEEKTQTRKLNEKKEEKQSHNNI